MRKILSILTICALVAVVFSCNKSNQKTTKPSVKKITTGIGVGFTIHNPIVNDYYNIYGYTADSFITEDEVITLGHQLEPIVTNYVSFENYTSTTVNCMRELNMFDESNILKLNYNDQILDIEPHIGFKQAILNINQLAGENFLDDARSEIQSISFGNDADAHERAELYLNILEASYVAGIDREPIEEFQTVLDAFYYLQWKSDVAEADARGFLVGLKEAIRAGDIQNAGIKAAAMASAFSILKERQLRAGK